MWQFLICQQLFRLLHLTVSLLVLQNILPLPGTSIMTVPKEIWLDRLRLLLNSAVEKDIERDISCLIFMKAHRLKKATNRLHTASYSVIRIKL